MSRLDDPDDRRAGPLGVLESFDEGIDDPAELSKAADTCASPEILEVVADELFGDDHDPDRLAGRGYLCPAPPRGR